MSVSQTNDHEYFFVLPLRWPAGDAARQAYESRILEYTRMMAPLIAASEAQERHALVTTLDPFVQDLVLLWAADAVPAEVATFINIIRTTQMGQS